MATQPLNRYTLEQYLEIEETLDYRSEFHNGRILPVEAASPNHSRLCAAIIGLLRSGFASRYSVFDSSLNLYLSVANKILHPDATVLCGKVHSPKPDCIDNPSILVEVTSPSTKDYDYGTKRESYFTLPSLRHYLLLGRTEPAVAIFECAEDRGAWSYVDLASDGIIFLATIRIPVAAIYAGILP